MSFSALLLAALAATARAQWDQPDFAAVHQSYTSTCTATAHFPAQELSMHHGAASWPSDSWVPPASRAQHEAALQQLPGTDNVLLVFRRADVPAAALHWVDAQRGGGGSGAAAGADVVVLAPGVFRASLPLWVAETAACKDALREGARAGAAAAVLRDGGVISWAQRTPASGSEVSVQVTAQVLRRREGAREDNKKKKKKTAPGLSRPTEPVYKEEL